MDKENLLELIIALDVQDGNPEDVDRLTRQLLTEIRSLEVESVALAKDDAAPTGTKSIDPVLVGALVIAIGPTLLTKFLEFLHDWAMRREGRTIKLKVQRSNNDSIEIEVPATMSQPEVQKWVESVNELLNKPKHKK